MRCALTAFPNVKHHKAQSRLEPASTALRRLLRRLLLSLRRRGRLALRRLTLLALRGLTLSRRSLLGWLLSRRSLLGLALRRRSLLGALLFCGRRNALCTARAITRHTFNLAYVCCTSHANSWRGIFLLLKITEANTDPE